MRKFAKKKKKHMFKQVSSVEWGFSFFIYKKIKNKNKNLKFIFFFSWKFDLVTSFQEVLETSSVCWK
jgi:hypothetical protein